MDLPASLRESLLVQPSAEIGPRTTLGVGGRAPWIIEPRRREELVLAVAELSAARIPFRLLGHGSNLLVCDEGVPEVVIHTRLMATIWRDDQREHGLRAEAGASLARLVSVCQRQGLAGAEPLIGIPGTVGGAVAGNAGSRHGWIGDVLAAVTIVQPDGSLREVSCRREEFGYRRSPFRGAVVLDALLQLQPDTPAAIWSRMSAILRAKADSQPLTARSAGCMFRNTAEAPSGRLIQDAGCKGLSVGAAQVSDQHANFILNTGGAVAADVWALVERVRDRVRRQSGHELELEVEVWGRPQHQSPPVPARPGDATMRGSKAAAGPRDEHRKASHWSAHEDT